MQKDPEKSARCRERGNSSFKSRDYTAAALHYSQVKSACLKPSGVNYCCMFSVFTPFNCLGF